MGQEDFALRIRKNFGQQLLDIASDGFHSSLQLIKLQSSTPDKCTEHSEFNKKNGSVIVMNPAPRAEPEVDLSCSESVPLFKQPSCTVDIEPPDFTSSIFSKSNNHTTNNGMVHSVSTVSGYNGDNPYCSLPTYSENSNRDECFVDKKYKYSTDFRNNKDYCEPLIHATQETGSSTFKQGAHGASSSSEDEEGSANASGYTRRKSKVRSSGGGGGGEERSVIITVDPVATTSGATSNGCHKSIDDNACQNGQLVATDANLEVLSPIPSEWEKTALAFVFFLMSWIATTLSLAVVHDYVPQTDPLPDIFLDNVPYQPWGLDVSEGFIIFSFISAIVVALNHQHRLIIFRRICLLVGLHYFYRAVTFQVTVLPRSNVDYICAPQNKSVSIHEIVIRVLKIMSGFGLSINGKHVYCGDFIYSGHTMTLLSCYLIISEYSPRRWFLLHWTFIFVTLTGIIFLLLGRGHYSVDVLIAYWVTTRVWWIYHTMSNHDGLRATLSDTENQINRIWWWRIFNYFEKNINRPLPEVYLINLESLGDVTERLKNRWGSSSSTNEVAGIRP